MLSSLANSFVTKGLESAIRSTVHRFIDFLLVRTMHACPNVETDRRYVSPRLVYRSLYAVFEHRFFPIRGTSVNQREAWSKDSSWRARYELFRVLATKEVPKDLLTGISLLKFPRILPLQFPCHRLVMHGILARERGTMAGAWWIRGIF